MEKTLIIMAGLPASGKSTYANKMFTGMEIVDCDAFKALIPGYDPKNPEAVHAQSKVMEKEAIYRNMAAGKSFVYDTTATNTDKVVALVSEAHTLGYKVEMHYIKVELATAIERNSKRARVVPMEIILEKYEQIEHSMEVAKLFVDKFVVKNND